MRIRIVTGDEREQLLARSKTGVDYGPYLEILADCADGEVVGVEIDGTPRAEQLRFARAATQLHKTLRWLDTATPGELTFEVRAGRRERPRPR
jgi:hypothetical protein